MQINPIISIRDVHTRLGAQQIHSGVTFDIAKPQVVALIGGSGCGKSVLLKETIGLLQPTSGEIRVLGVPIWKSSAPELSSVRRKFGVLFQNGALFSGLTVRENVAAPLREQTDLDAATIDQIVRLRLGLSGLSSESANKMPAELSGGMRKRAALARALAMEPEILFLDEPTSGLDPINARAFDRLVRTLCDSLGLTVVLVTHDLDTLEGIVDRVVVLGDGKVLADGTVQQVRGVEHEWIRTYFNSRAI